MRLLLSITYMLAAIANLWPTVILAMTTAFSGVDEHSPLLTCLLLLTVAAIFLDALAASALLVSRRIPQWIFYSGPALTLIVSAIASMTMFRESALRSVLPQTVVAALALLLRIADNSPART